MLRILIALAFVATVFYIVFVKGNSYKSIGKTMGICVEVKVEYDDNDGSPYNEQMRGMDNRMYRPYIQYQWEGKEYIAESYVAYGQAKFFPGDKIQILVNESDKNIVKII